MNQLYNFICQHDVDCIMLDSYVLVAIEWYYRNGRHRFEFYRIHNFKEAKEVLGY